MLVGPLFCYRFKMWYFNSMLDILSVKLYLPLAEERNKWKMFSHTPLGPGPMGLFFESHAQCCLSVAFFAVRHC